MNTQLAAYLDARGDHPTIGKRILAALHKHGGMTRHELIAAVGCSPSGICQPLKDLQTADLITVDGHKTGPYRHQNWIYKIKQGQGELWDT